MTNSHTVCLQSAYSMPAVQLLLRDETSFESSPLKLSCIYSQTKYYSSMAQRNRETNSRLTFASQSKVSICRSSPVCLTLPLELHDQTRHIRHGRQKHEHERQKHERNGYSENSSSHSLMGTWYASVRIDENQDIVLPLSTPTNTQHRCLHLNALMYGKPFFSLEPLLFHTFGYRLCNQNTQGNVWLCQSTLNKAMKSN